MTFFKRCQERCFTLTDFVLLCCKCKNIYKCFFHDEVIRVYISGHLIKKKYKICKFLSRYSILSFAYLGIKIKENA